MKITIQSVRLLFFLLTMALFIIYFIFWYLQTARSLSELSIGIAIYWTILLPVTSALPYGYSYIVCFPSPIFGAWMLIIILIERHISLVGYFLLLTFPLSFLLVFLVHVLTRKRTMFWKIPMASLSRSSIAALSLILFVFGMLLIDPSLKLDPVNEIFYFFVILFAYVSSSMLYINSSYRLFALSNRLHVQNLENELSKIWKAIQKGYPEQDEDLDLLQYYFSESLRCFLEGDIEKGYDWGYKVIREKTIVDPLKFVDDKRVNKPSFGDIRNTLMHSRRKGRIDKSKISQIRKNLFNDLLDLLEREFIFIKKVSEVNSQKMDCARAPSV